MLAVSRWTAGGGAAMDALCLARDPAESPSRETEPGRAARLSQKDEEEHTGVDVRHRRNARAWLCLVPGT